MELFQRMLSAAAKNSEPYFGYCEFRRSLSPTYTLPPAADAMAQAMALQMSPKQHRSCSLYDPRTCQYIDNEALESRNAGTQSSGSSAKCQQYGLGLSPE
jgi:hypothetical protein